MFGRILGGRRLIFSPVKERVASANAAIIRPARQRGMTAARVESAEKCARRSRILRLALAWPERPDAWR